MAERRRSRSAPPASRAEKPGKRGRGAKEKSQTTRGRSRGRSQEPRGRADGPDGGKGSRRRAKSAAASGRGAGRRGRSRSRGKGGGGGGEEAKRKGAGRGRSRPRKRRAVSQDRARSRSAGPKGGKDKGRRSRSQPPASRRPPGDANKKATPAKSQKAGLDRRHTAPAKPRKDRDAVQQQQQPWNKDGPTSSAFPRVIRVDGDSSKGRPLPERKLFQNKTRRMRMPRITGEPRDEPNRTLTEAERNRPRSSSNAMRGGSAGRGGRRKEHMQGQKQQERRQERQRQRQERQRQSGVEKSKPAGSRPARRRGGAGCDGAAAHRPAHPAGEDGERKKEPAARRTAGRITQGEDGRRKGEPPATKRTASKTGRITQGPRASDGVGPGGGGKSDPSRPKSDPTKPGRKPRDPDSQRRKNGARSADDRVTAKAGRAEKAKRATPPEPAKADAAGPRRRPPPGPRAGGREAAASAVNAKSRNQPPQEPRADCRVVSPDTDKADAAGPDGRPLPGPKMSDGRTIKLRLTKKARSTGDDPAKTPVGVPSGKKRTKKKSPRAEPPGPPGEKADGDRPRGAEAGADPGPPEPAGGPSEPAEDAEGPSLVTPVEEPESAAVDAILKSILRPPTFIDLPADAGDGVLASPSSEEEDAASPGHSAGQSTGGTTETESLTDEEYGDECDGGPSPAGDDGHQDDETPDRHRHHDETPEDASVEAEDDDGEAPVPPARDAAAIVRRTSPAPPCARAAPSIPRPPPWYQGDGISVVTPLPLPLKRRNVVTFDLSDID